MFKKFYQMRSAVREYAEGHSLQHPGRNGPEFVRQMLQLLSGLRGHHPLSPRGLIPFWLTAPLTENPPDPGTVSLFHICLRDEVEDILENGFRPPTQEARIHAINPLLPPVAFGQRGLDRVSMTIQGAEFAFPWCWMKAEAIGNPLPDRPLTWSYHPKDLSKLSAVKTQLPTAKIAQVMLGQAVILRNGVREDYPVPGVEVTVDRENLGSMERSSISELLSAPPSPPLWVGHKIFAGGLRRTLRNLNVPIEAFAAEALGSGIDAETMIYEMSRLESSVLYAALLVSRHSEHAPLAERARQECAKVESVGRSRIEEFLQK